MNLAVVVYTGAGHIHIGTERVFRVETTYLFVILIEIREQKSVNFRRSRSYQNTRDIAGNVLKH